MFSEICVFIYLFCERIILKTCFTLYWLVGSFAPVILIGGSCGLTRSKVKWKGTTKERLILDLCVLGPRIDCHFGAQFLVM